MSQTDTLTTRGAFRDELRRDLLLRANDFYRDLAEVVEPADTNGTATNGHDEFPVTPAEVKILTRRAFIDLVNETFEIPLPPPSEHHAEVSTPAKIIVAAECPKCAIAQPIEVKITPELLVDPDGSELRIKAKAKGRVHVCGQLPLPEIVGDEASAQLTLDGVQVVVEIVPDASAPTDLVDEGEETPDCQVTAPVAGVDGYDGDPDARIVCHRAVHAEGDHYDSIAGQTWRLVPAATYGLITEATIVHEDGTEEVVQADADGFITLRAEGNGLEAPAIAEDDELLPGGPALECRGSVHVPGCEHMGGVVPMRARREEAKA